MEKKLLTKVQIENSPSRKDGISLEEETRVRRAFAFFIQQVGIGLDLPFTTLCTSCTYFHRFYSCVSLLQHDPALVAQACLLLAAKAEENPRRVRDVINVAYALQHSHQIVSEGYWLMKEQVIKMEQVLLRVFGYDMEFLHPHQYALHFIRDLEGSADLASVTWCVLNDSLATTVCLQYPAYAIACSAIHLAQEMINEQVAHGEWWEKFNTHRIEIEDVCCQLCDMYDQMQTKDLTVAVAGVAVASLAGTGSGTAVTSLFTPGGFIQQHNLLQQPQNFQAGSSPFNLTTSASSSSTGEAKSANSTLPAGSSPASSRTRSGGGKNLSLVSSLYRK